ncbi:hypothetical protein JH26_04400 [Microvirga sp. BSC39]|nr:hypothetical protein JH26_04400 [Microvirga sp. BSC39]
MRILYYAKLTLFLLLAAVGGMIGAVLSAIASFVLAPFMIGIVESVTYSQDFPLSVVIFSGYCFVAVSFAWSFVRSYTILVRTFW